MQLEPWTTTLGVIARPPTRGARLKDLAPAAVLEALAAHGVVLFRDFPAELEDFSAFTEAFAVPFLLHGGRAHRPIDGVDPTIRQVTSGAEAVGLHSEASGLPVRPDYLWLKCEAPAALGGDTVLLDGAALWAALPAGVQGYFRQRWLHYTSGPSGIGPAEWGRAFGADDADEAERRIEAFGRGLDPRFERMTLTRGPGDRFVGHYAVCAVVPSRFGGREAFANALFGPYRVFPTFEGGEVIPDPLLAEVGRAFGPLCHRLAWQAGDVVMVDNWRVMHGRLPFVGARRILTRMGGARCAFPLFS